MQNLVTEISKVDAATLNELIIAIVRRHTQLFPDWELNIISLPRCGSRDKMIDNAIELWKSMKTQKPPL